MAIDKAGDQPIIRVGSKSTTPPSVVGPKEGATTSKGTPSAAPQYAKAAAKFTKSPNLQRFLAAETTRRNEGDTGTDATPLASG